MPKGKGYQVTAPGKNAQGKKYVKPSGWGTIVRDATNRITSRKADGLETDKRAKKK